MSAGKARRPVALIVDDDPDMARLLTHLLGTLGVDARATAEVTGFIGELAKGLPDICLIDLNMNRIGEGFAVVQAIRNQLGPDLPLFIISGTTEPHAVAHAIEIGANDYIIKPVDREILATKLAPYISSPEISDAGLSSFPVAGGGAAAIATLDFQLDEVDELGIRLRSRHLVGKDAILRLSAPILEEITGRAGPFVMRAISTWAVPAEELYGIQLEFDAGDEALRSAVRRWLATHANANAGGEADAPAKG